MKIIFLVGTNAIARKTWAKKQDPSKHVCITGYQYTKERLMDDLQRQLHQGKTCIVDLEISYEDIRKFSHILGKSNVSIMRPGKSVCKG